MNFAVEREFTETYRRYQHAHPALREAMCLKAQFPGYLLPMEPGDLLAGRIAYGAVGFSPQEGGIGLGYYVKPDPNLPADLREFWRTESTAAKVRAAFPPHLQEWLPTDDWSSAPRIAYPIYRLLGGCLDFDRLLRQGLPGLRSAVDHEGPLYEAMRIAIDVVADCCRWYADQAADAGLAADLSHIAEHPPETFRQAMQLAWLYALLSGQRNYGRLDVYLGDFYAADLAAGRITPERATELLLGLWRLIWARHLIFDGRVVVGGRGRRNPANADQVALLAIEATRRHQATEPQLTLRFHREQDPALYDLALTAIGEGRTYPLLYNDDVNVPAVAKAFRVPECEAEQYMPFSCGEYALDHMSYGSPNGVMNLLQALQAALHDGREPLTGARIGLPTGPLTSFEDVWNAYRAQVEHYVRVMADFQALSHKVAGETAPFLLTAMLYDDCVARGKGMFDGGIRYLGGTLECYGNTNTADSLTAIRRLVFEEKRFTLEQLVAMLDADFAGFPAEQKWLAAAPKYGNDDETADDMAVLVHEHVCGAIRAQAERTGMDSYLAVIINNSANTTQGQLTGASPDGRLARQPMANANNPAPGADRAGLTALLNSLVKLDPALHAGAVQNLKLSPSLFRSEQTKALLDTYWEQGGAQAMITVVSRGDLEAALKEPEKYQHLFVRVGGFSARFVRLDPPVQQEVLSRTLY
ncbi:MAG TPA: pyruvate formate lyase family protein [Symbiobacteriaceae bacterium]|nr:pyruvate formate lyase family protein [Symbiobacteriaceae bacterium]